MTPQHHECNYGDAIPRMDEKMDTMLESQKRIIEFIDGNGKPGAKVRLDRIERLIYAVGTILVLVAGAWAQAYFGGKNEDKTHLGAGGGSAVAAPVRLHDAKPYARDFLPTD